ncbi:MAG: PSD1 and planctomycete cytochrome C domain-containing protein [bacterium]|nr:PSD1 and planctomycete cytochrome C domain-containing protein [bacterium]
MLIRLTTFLGLAATTLLFCGELSNPAYAADGEVDFANDIQTVLARRCYSCHGPDMQESGLRFDVRESLLGEADSGLAAVIPGKSADSELLRRIQSPEDYERMPPEGEPLTEEEISLFRKWIDGGAEFETHWAFQPVTRPAIPEVENRMWARTAVDNFILSKIEQANLKASPPATPQQLIRRLYLDVTGLPPEPEVVAELIKNWSEETYERLVDSLLASPAFGERWARHWLDVVRYAETNSYERDGAKPNAWKYRDYVIRSMNSDKPYDRFLQEQIAGDQLGSLTDDALTATGYYRLGIWDDEPADPQQALFDGFDDLVSTTGQGILGLTFNCARCHDHKIDPITQRDYYSLVAFLRDVTPYGTRADQTGNNQIDLDPELAAKHAAFRQRLQDLERRRKKIEQQAIKKMSATDQRATEGPERQQTLDSKLSDYVDDTTFAEYQQLVRDMEQIQQEQASLPPRRTVLGLARTEPEPPTTYVLLRGSPQAEGDAVEPSFPRLLGGGKPELPAAEVEGSSDGRRRALAEWLTSKQNWMTARVIVNRVWLHYFGRGIVRSPNNFGLMGDPPTHPELIDHLAMELMDHDWHLKSLHRTLLLSSAYRLSTSGTPLALEQDPANDLFSRQNLRRLSAEQVRDSVLQVCGQMNAEKYGPSMYPQLSEEVLASQSRPGQGWGDSSAAERARRSIYIHVKRSLPVPLLSAFDFPETDISCEARFLTTQPGQALTMLNSQWIGEQAGHLYERVRAEVGSDLRQQAARCLELCLSHAGDAQDIDELVQLVHKLVDEHHLSDDDARRAMCLVALNLNEFLYID